MNFLKGKTDLVTPYQGSTKTAEKTETSTPALKAEDTPSTPPTDPGQVLQTWNNLLNGQGTQGSLNPFLIDAGAPTGHAFRGPILVPNLHRDIYSKFHNPKTSADIPYRAIIVKYDALIRTFRAMTKDLNMIMKGGKIKPSEAPAIHSRIAELNNAITKAESYKREAETDFERALAHDPAPPVHDETEV